MSEYEAFRGSPTEPREETERRLCRRNPRGGIGGVSRHPPEELLTVALALILVVLLVKPSGLFGRAIVRRV